MTTAGRSTRNRLSLSIEPGFEIKLIPKISDFELKKVLHL